MLSLYKNRNPSDRLPAVSFPPLMPPLFKNRLTLLILVSTAVRIILAAATELGNDEVYYWTYSQHLQWNYFDHPPLVALWIRGFTANLALEQYEVFVRLGSILSAALCTLLIYKITVRIANKRAGWYAACLYTASLYASIIAGVFILPDSPQALFWCASLYFIVRICEVPRSWFYWMLFGVAAGLCIMSKVHGIFLWAGLGWYILLKSRDWLKLPQLYVAALLTAVIISPILLWNRANDFITYRFHSQRVEVHGLAIDFTTFAREVFGEFFYNNPFNVAILVAALAAWKRRRITPSTPLSVYGFIALPMIGILVAVSLFRTTFPHWSGPGYVTLLPLSGVYLSTLPSPQMPARLKWALGTIAVVATLGLGLIYLYPGTMGSRKEERFGHGDFTLDLHGWTAAGRTFDSLYKSETTTGIMPKGAPVVAHKWFPAAHLDYYFCRPVGAPLIGLGTEIDLHHYLWLNRWRAPQAAMEKAYAIIPSNLDYNVAETFGNYYTTADSVTTIHQSRLNKPVRYFTVYRLQGWKGAPVPLQH
ncbi:MAG: glycosyl transferase family protein [Flaviaesturariibacter sp.]|nr:glycosyl transferase family protein [Flaviaesturariibacter sp.]